VKVSLLGVVVVLLVVTVGYRQAKATAKKTDSDIREVADILDKAVANAPPVPAGPPTGPWVDGLNAECDRRERLLSRLARPAALDGIGGYAQRILEIHQGHARRVAALRPPARYLADAERIEGMNARQVRVLVRVARAALAGDVASATKDARSLRVLAGEANAELLRLGLTGCLLRPSGMPL
jgi:hypothetical protein